MCYSATPICQVSRVGLLRLSTADDSCLLYILALKFNSRLSSFLNSDGILQELILMLRCILVPRCWPNVLLHGEDGASKLLPRLLRARLTVALANRYLQFKEAAIVDVFILRRTQNFIRLDG
jgi:hypothetical protein